VTHGPLEILREGEIEAAELEKALGPAEKGESSGA
jgi:hypothetical protein